MLRLDYIRNGTTGILSLHDRIVIAKVQNATGYTVTLKTSQGLNQIGSSIDNASVAGQTLTITGFVLDGDTTAKRQLLATFAPLSSGRLYWDDAYWLDVAVKSSPAITQEYNSTFTMQLYAAFPYWREMNKSRCNMGGITPEYSFPVNYSASHRFGTYRGAIATDCVVVGDVPVEYEMHIFGQTAIVNPMIANQYTGQFIRFIGTISVGQMLNFYRADGRLRVTLSENGVETNAFDMFDDDSSLFTVDSGDNVLVPSADTGIEHMQVEILYYNAHAGVLANGV